VLSDILPLCSISDARALALAACDLLFPIGYFLSEGIPKELFGIFFRVAVVSFDINTPLVIKFTHDHI
jgi:hypothetical protein